MQIEGISKLLDGVDIFTILRTGMGKKSLISIYMLVLLKILRREHKTHES